VTSSRGTESAGSLFGESLGIVIALAEPRPHALTFTKATFATCCFENRTKSFVSSARFFRDRVIFVFGGAPKALEVFLGNPRVFHKL
jgi:hypothetical protein